MVEYNRQTAKKCRISQLLNGNYVEQEGWEPNYVETEIGMVSRVNIMAIVVAKEDNVLAIDDGSGRIEVRSFGEISLDFDVGDRVLVIARPRVYNDNLYLAVEIVKKIVNDKWLEYRKIELSNVKIVSVEKKPVKEVMIEPKGIDEKLEEAQESVKTGDDVVEKIKLLDTGNGADVEEVIKGLSNGEKIIDMLLQEGEIFEVKPGRIKVLD